MTQPNLPAGKPAAKRAIERTQQITAIRDFADWLTLNPAALVPTLTLTRHLHNGMDGTEVENLDTVRAAAASLGVGTDESLDDRTVLRVKVNEHVWYELFAWHKAGRDQGSELERLRAEVAELRAASAWTKAGFVDGPCGDPDCPNASWPHSASSDLAAPDPSGLGYSREPESTVVTPVPAGVEGHPEFGRAAS